MATNNEELILHLTNIVIIIIDFSGCGEKSWLKEGKIELAGHCCNVGREAWKRPCRGNAKLICTHVWLVNCTVALTRVRTPCVVDWLGGFGGPAWSPPFPAPTPFPPLPSTPLPPVPAFPACSPRIAQEHNLLITRTGIIKTSTDPVCPGSYLNMIRLVYNRSCALSSNLPNSIILPPSQSS